MTSTSSNIVIVTGPNDSFVETTVMRFERRVTHGVRLIERLILRGFRSLGYQLVDVNQVKVMWRSLVVDSYTPMLERAWLQAASVTQQQLDPAITAASSPGTSLSTDAVESAATYLTRVKTQMLTIGDILWNRLTTSLNAGVSTSENQRLMYNRISAVVNDTIPLAQTTARTEMRGVLNRAVIYQIRVANVAGTKRWISVDDRHTRSSHTAVNGTTVKLRETFLVGGSQMDGPYDPSAPSSEVNNCRCHLTFEIQI